MEQSNHTITFLPAGRSQTTMISKRDVGNWDQQPCCSNRLINKEVPETQQQTKPRELPNSGKLTTPEEMTIPEELANQQCTATTTNELTNQSQEKAKRGTSALKALKQKAKKTEAKPKQEKAQ